jgi:hypothetical protein
MGHQDRRPRIGPDFAEKQGISCPNPQAMINENVPIARTNKLPIPPDFSAQPNREVPGDGKTVNVNTTRLRLEILCINVRCGDVHFMASLC